MTDVPAALRGNVNDVLLGALARAVRSWQVAREILDEQPVTVLVEGHGRQEELVASGATHAARTCHGPSAGSPRSPRWHSIPPTASCTQ